MFNMNCETINNYLEKYNVPLQNIAHTYNTTLGEVLEITELYLLINSTWDTLQLYYHLDFYPNDELEKYNVPLQNIAHTYNTTLGEVLEITELYLLINSTWDTLQLYYHLDFYPNDELKNAISEFVCDTL